MTRLGTDLRQMMPGLRSGEGTEVYRAGEMSRAEAIKGHSKECVWEICG